MRIEAKRPETGESIFVDISEQQYHALGPLTAQVTSRRKVQSHIDNLNMSADAKNFVSSFLDLTINVGTTLLKLGQRIVEIVLAIFNKFPNTSFGLLLGLLIGMLAASIPFLGALLGPFVLPIATLFGLTSGYLDDARDVRLQAKLREAVETFSPLQGQL